MKIGCVKEIKKHEYRVGLTPACVRSYAGKGHEVFIEKDAGSGSGFKDDEYIAAGAVLKDTAAEVFAEADMIIKVKEPQPSEYEMFREGQILYTYLHLAAEKELTDALLRKKVKAVAYETIEEKKRLLPCLKPMSEIAGRLSIQEGAKYLEKSFGGRGILLGGVPGVSRGKVAILGGGVVGLNAAQIAMGVGADVTILDISSERLEYIDNLYYGRIQTLYSTEANIEKVLKQSDLVIGAVLIPGAKAPHLVRREHLSIMKPGAVLVDVAVDQGGCIETSHPTTHDDPVFTIDGIVHYCVANMPGAVSRTSTQALTSTTLRYGLKIAGLGLEEACRKDTAIMKGLNTYNGKCTYPDVAKGFDLEWANPAELF